jgi:uncharacterized protein
MICPVCKESMLVVEREHIELDHCSNCGGVWFDSGELELLLAGLAIAGSDTFLKGILESPDEKIDEPDRRCPICSRKTKKTILGTRPKVIIDICSQGHGLWFDGGELNTFLDQVVDTPGNGIDSKRKLSSFLGDVFRARNAEKHG